MAIEIVDLPIQNGGFTLFFVCLPAGTILITVSRNIAIYPDVLCRYVLSESTVCLWGGDFRCPAGQFDLPVMLPLDHRMIIHMGRVQKSRYV